MTVEPTRRIPWPRVLAEGVVIVASILLAFAIDAWWDGRQQRREEQVVLRGLQAEFEQNRLISAEVDQQVGQAVRDLEAFLALSANRMGQVPLDST